MGVQLRLQQAPQSPKVCALQGQALSEVLGNAPTLGKSKCKQPELIGLKVFRRFKAVATKHVPKMHDLTVQ